MYQGGLHVDTDLTCILNMPGYQLQILQGLWSELIGRVKEKGVKGVEFGDTSGHAGIALKS